MVQIMQGAETFLLRGSSARAVLLLHGYTGTTAEMRPLGEYLHGLGFTVMCPRLPGHGTTVEDLERTAAGQWIAAAKAAYALLAREYAEIYVAGLSMGGLLAITLAATEKVAGAALLAAPIFVQDKRAPFFPLLRFFIRYLPKHRREYGELTAYCLSYGKMPTRPLGSLFALIRRCKRQLLPRITVPCLIMQSKKEHTVAPDSARYIYEHIATPPASKQLLWLERSGHILTLDCEHQAVFAAIGRFFSR